MSVKASAVLLFLLSLWTYGLLAATEPSNPQSITRLALSLSMLDRHTTEITPFAPWTVDYARVGNHYFADKTPGHPLLALPALAITEGVFRLTGQSLDTSNPDVFLIYSRWATVGTNGIISAAAVAVLFLIATGLGASRPAALFAAFALGWATPFMVWSTAFFAHSVTGSFLLFSLGLVLWTFPDGPPRQRKLGWLGLATGIILGFTLVVDLTAAPAAALIAAFALLRAHAAGRLPVYFSALVAGGILGLIPLLIYNGLTFGSIWHLGYSDTEFAGMQQGFFGLTWPHPAVAIELLFGAYRGLLPLSPILLLVPFGLAKMFREPGQRAVAVLIALVALVYLLINASYFYWDGGSSTGPRHMVAALPLLAVAFAFAWPKTFPWQVVAVALMIVSLGLSLVCATASMLAPFDHQNPLLTYLLPHALTPGGLVKGSVVVSVWLLFGMLLFRSGTPALKTNSAADRLPSAE